MESAYKRGLIFFLFFVASLQADLRQELAPYLIPENHIAKSALDAIFGGSRVIKNQDSLIQAGFKKTKPAEITGLIVTTHPSLPGYIFKIFTDSVKLLKVKTEYELWIRRITGANLIREAIFSRSLSSKMKVPHKWIYILPYLPTNKSYPKSTILIEEDMDLLSEEANLAFWKSDSITAELLKDLFFIIKDLGLDDCLRPDNIPFSHDGRLSFVDTESYYSNKVKFKKLTPYLSKKNQGVWKSLIDRVNP